MAENRVMGLLRALVGVTAFLLLAGFPTCLGEYVCMHACITVYVRKEGRSDEG